jgi:hypothetical protein
VCGDPGEHAGVDPALGSARHGDRVVTALNGMGAFGELQLREWILG